MTWGQKTIARILLIIASMMADEEINKELSNLSAHIAVSETKEV